MSGSTSDGRKLSQMMLRSSTANAILEHINEALITLDAGMNILDLNRAAHDMFGYQDEEIIGQPFLKLVALGDMDCDVAEMTNRPEFLCDAIHKSGNTFPGEFVLSPIHDEDLVHHIVIVRDLSTRKAIENALHREKELAQITLHSIAEAVLTTDANGVINSANSASADLLGSTEEDLVGRPLTDKLVLDNLDQRRELRKALKDALEYGVSTELNDSASLAGKSGEEVAIAGLISPLRDSDGKNIGSVIVLQNVTNERRMQELLSHQATHDELTGLANRREFERRLQEQLRIIKTNHIAGAALLLDLDRFKIVNDTCGHAAGDLLLRQLTQLMSVQIRSSDTLARIGGDEFAVLLPSCDDKSAGRVAESLRQTVAEYRFRWENRNFALGVSIGIVNLDMEWSSVAEVISAADSACLMAKEAGRDRVITYRKAGEEEQKRRGEIEWAARIRESLELNRFRLYCQPIVPISPDNDRWSVEVLVRMVDAEGNMVPPMAFIPAAERYDEMTYIDRWVVENTIKQWDADPETFNAMDKCNINLSGQSLANEAFLDFVIELIENHKVPWEKVCFEITETAVVANLEIARAFIEELSGRGCRFALDDFGSGLSSFAYLKHLPVHFLKIDGVFVKDILNDKIDAAMVESIAQIGHAMDLETIAEFVENDEVIAALNKSNVDYAQGFGVCRPFPLEELGDYIAKQTQKKGPRKIAM